MVAAAIWSAVFAVLYFSSYRAVLHTSYMRVFWSAHFLHPRSREFIGELTAAIYVLLGTEHFDSVRSLILGPLFAVGVYGIWHRLGPKAALVALFPFLSILAAAMLQQYPIANRLVLFIFPILFWVYATGLVTISDQFPARVRATLSVGLTLALLGPTAVKTVRYVLHFPQREASRQVIAWMKATDSSAPVYVGLDEYLQWAYYAGDWNHPDALQAQIAVAFHAAHRTEFVYMAGNAEKKQIVGQLPPAAWDTAENDLRWANDEAAAI